MSGEVVSPASTYYLMLYELRLKALAPATRGIYKIGGVDGRMPTRALRLHPDAAEAFVALESATGGLVYSDIWRSAEASLEARKSKRGVQRPGFSAHNWGIAFDCAVDATLKLHDWKYPQLVAACAQHGWYCHRADGARGFEDWHFNWLGAGNKAHGESAALQRVRALYDADLALDAKEVQAGLMRLRMYRGDIDGIIGPRSQEAIEAFARAWLLPTAEWKHTSSMFQQTLAFVASDVVTT